MKSDYVNTKEQILDDYRVALQRIVDWAAEAYSEDFFPTQDLKKADVVLAEHGISMSAMHAQWARKLVGGIGKIAKEALA